jgi:inosine/xanthosine triphosphate pyrophosphatase family protein
MNNKAFRYLILVVVGCLFGLSIFLVIANNHLAKENFIILTNQKTYIQQIKELQNNQLENDKLINELKLEASEKNNKPIQDVLSYNVTLNKKLAIIDDSEDLGYYPEQELDGNYSIESALSNHNRIEEIFLSFIDLTKTVDRTLTDSEKNEIGNMDWTMQMIGFSNIATRNEVIIREMRYIISKLNFEIAILKYKNSEINQDEIKKAEETFINERNNYEEYANNVGFAD